MMDVPQGHSSQPEVPGVGERSRRGRLGRRARPSPELGGGAYRLERWLFEDPLGTVWDAVGSGTRARVAVRVFEGPVVGTPEARRRLRSRLRATPQIRHPNVALVFSHEVKDKGYAFMTMEELQGETLAQRLRRDGPVPLEEATELGAALARGLSAAHERGVTHGGIAPEMVFITSRGPKLLGLGIGDLVHSRAGRSGNAAADDVLGLMRLVQTIAASPFTGANGEPGWPVQTLPGGVVGRGALNDDPAARPSAQELAAALGGGLGLVDEPVEGIHPVPPDFPRDEREQGERVELDTMKRAEREPPERDRAERAVSIPGRATVAVTAVMLVAAIGIGGQALFQNEGVSSPPASPSIASAPPAFIPATVPDVLGRTVPTAEQRIFAANLEVGEIVPIAGKPGRVVRTDPTPGEAVRAGTPITIYVGETGG